MAAVGRRRFTRVAGASGWMGWWVGVIGGRTGKWVEVVAWWVGEWVDARLPLAERALTHLL